MPNRYSSRSSANLNNEILTEPGATGAAGGMTLYAFTRLLTSVRSSDAMLRRVRGYVQCRAGGTASSEMVRFALMGSDKAGNVPIYAARNLEDQNYWEIPCVASRDTTNNWDNPAQFHFDLSLSLKVPLTRDLYVGVINDGTLTNFFAFVFRLFWSLI